MSFRTVRAAVRGNVSAKTIRGLIKRGLIPVMRYSSRNVRDPSPVRMNSSRRALSRPRRSARPTLRSGRRRTRPSWQLVARERARLGP
jgi:hypothetical protein